MARAGRGVRALELGLAATLIAGCGSSRAGDAGLPAAADAVPGIETRRCEYVSSLDELPSLEELTRSGTRGNIALWGREMAPEDSVHLSIRYDDDGRIAWARAIESTLPAERTSALESLVLEALTEPGPEDWGVRLRVVGGDVVGIEPSVICDAAIIERPQRLVGLPVTSAGRYALYQARGLRFPVQIALDEKGRIMDVRLGRRIGQTEADQFLVDWVRSLRFAPRRHDGIGVPTVVDELVSLPRRSW